MLIEKNLTNMKQKFIKRFIKYFIVGILTFCFNLSLVFLITEYLDLYYLISASIVFFFTGGVAFILNKIWTFKENLKKKFLEEYLSFAKISLIAIFLNLSLLYIFTNYFKIYYLISQGISVLIVGVFSFIANSTWTFIKRKN